ncbi:nuclear transport factor 2 family protein [Stappia sp.]|uniref:nuclear transport factor 2 family protein n=1 Tax=Stappia sp. TaxID=1870903 RepID=UPI0032D9495F
MTLAPFPKSEDPARAALVQAVEAYFRACNSGEKSAFFSLFEDNACHYLPKGMFGPFTDVESLYVQWRRDAEDNGAYWVLDTVFADPQAGTAVAEWTAVKPAQKIWFRGVDVFRFAATGKIREVRVYYAAPRDPAIGPNELGGYDYAAGPFARVDTRSYGLIQEAEQKAE